MEVGFFFFSCTCMKSLRILCVSERFVLNEKLVLHAHYPVTVVFVAAAEGIDKLLVLVSPLNEIALNTITIERHIQ